MSEFSGPQWCERFPTSKTFDGLVEPFKSNVAKFYAALKDASPTVSVSINATLRPLQRVYLMHAAWKIAKGEWEPDTILKASGVDIDWTHSGDHIAAKVAAKAMVDKYSIAYEPSLTSLHPKGEAIDWTISWSGHPLKIRRASGTIAQILTGPTDGSNTSLWNVGSEYGVHKLASDPPHWSINGH